MDFVNTKITIQCWKIPHNCLLIHPVCARITLSTEEGAGEKEESCRFVNPLGKLVFQYSTMMLLPCFGKRWILSFFSDA